MMNNGRPIAIQNPRLNAGWLKTNPRQPRTGGALFAHAVCILCLCMQRFGVSVGGGQLFISLIIIPPLIFWLLMSGKARISTATALVFVVMVLCFLFSTVAGVLVPDPRMRFSLLSIMELSVVYSVLAVEPADGFDTKAVLRVFVFYARLIAVCGIAEYALQFVGIRLFSFAQFSSALHPFLTEPGYNTVTVIKYGSPILRSNGFFLLEPSLLSQVMALAIVVDFFVLARFKFLPFYAVAALASYSGTGPLALAGTLVLFGLLSPAQLRRTALFLVVAVVVGGICAVIFPAEFATLAGRASGSDASSQLRYTSQLTALQTIIGDPRVIIGFGPGAADGYATLGSMSPALKLFIDYGLVGLIAFSCFMIKVLWRRDMMVVSIICLITFQVGGGYLLFPPFVFLFALLCIWSKPVLEPGMARALPPRGHAFARVR